METDLKNQMIDPLKNLNQHLDTPVSIIRNQLLCLKNRAEAAGIDVSNKTVGEVRRLLWEKGL